MKRKIRNLFFTYRNGIVADTLKKAGDVHSQIFGLQLPQLNAISKEIAEDLSRDERLILAKELYNEKSCRESRLLAFSLMDASMITTEEAETMLRDCQTHEETDILVFRCLRHHTDAAALQEKFDGTYSGEALKRFL